MRLIITRHGETEENVKKIIMGSLLPGNLSKKGREQAKKLAERLRKEKIDTIYSSDLSRASDTARGVAGYHPHTELVLTKEIRECDFGEFQGKPMEEVGLRNFLERYEELDFSSVGGENTEQIFMRAEGFLNSVIKKHLNDTILLVTHEVFKKVLICVILNKGHEHIKNLGKLDNTSLSIFEIDEDRSHKIHVLDCTKHLE